MLGLLCNPGLLQAWLLILKFTSAGNFSTLIEEPGNEFILLTLGEQSSTMDHQNIQTQVG